MLPIEPSRSTRAALDALFRPERVAIVGASSDEHNLIASAPLANLRAFGFSGDVYLVNPRVHEVAGEPCYRSVSALPSHVDAAIVVVPAAHVPSVIAELDTAGVLVATIAAAGAELPSTSMRVLGPESLGVTNLVDGYVGRAAKNQRPPHQTRQGNIAIVTQSGAASNLLFNRATSAGAGIAYSVNTGGEADLCVWDLVDFLVDDEVVSTIMVVIESINRPAAMVAAAAKARDRQKPIVLLELGRSPTGAAAVHTHSGSVAGSAAVHDEVFRRLGVVVVQDFDELWQTAMLFSRWGVNARPSAERRVGIISFSGGESALLADRAHAIALALAPLSPMVREQLTTRFPECGQLNPFDPTTQVLSNRARAEHLFDFMVGGDEFTDLLIALPVYGDSFAHQRLPPLLAALDRSTANTVLSLWSAPPFTDAMVELVRDAGVPLVGTSVQTLTAIHHHLEYGEALAFPGRRPVLRSPRERADDGVGDASYAEARRILAEVGFSFPAAAVLSTAASEDEVADVCQALAPPYVVKGNTSSLVHKATASLVHLGLTNAGQVHRALQALQSRSDDGGISVTTAVVEEHVVGDWELFFGARLDDEFGPVIAFGFGGTMTEAVGDTAVGLPPFERGDAAELISRTAVGRSIFRTAPGAAAAVASLLESLAAWIENAEVVSVDLNPVALRRDGGVKALDARVEYPTKP